MQTQPKRRNRDAVTLMAVAVAVCGAALVPGTTVRAAGMSKYVFSPAPIAQMAHLAAGQSVPVTVTAEDSSGVAVPGVVIYLTFHRASGGGSASAGPGKTAITPTPVAFTADTGGQVAITYTAPANYAASTSTTKRSDVITAQNAASKASVHRSDSYSFTPLNDFHFNPSVIAAPGKLVRSAQVAVTVTAQTYPDVGLGNELLYLSLQSTGTLGTASANGVALTSSPKSFRADAAGAVHVTYTASSATTLPTTGTDSIVAQDRASSPVVTGFVSYSYGKPASYTFTPTPVAPSGSLQGATTVSVTLSVFDAQGGSVAGAKVYLTFSQASGGGSASVQCSYSSVDVCSLSGTAAAYYSDSGGRLLISYSTPSPAPSSGSDMITAANSGTSATLSRSDGYTF